MSTEQHRKRLTARWMIFCAVVLVAGLIVLGLVLDREQPTTPGPVATSSGSDSGGGGASDGGGTDGQEDQPTDGQPTDGQPTDDQPTEPPRDIGIDPQQPRPTEAPGTAPAPDDGSGVELEPVAPEAIVEAPHGAVVSLSRIEAVHGQATVGGETSGPAIRVSVALQNDGEDPIDLEYVVVNAYVGQDRTPAPPLMQPGGEPFAGSLSAGGSAEGVYLFSVDESEREDVVITVDYGVGEPIVVFRGDLS